MLTVVKNNTTINRDLNSDDNILVTKGQLTIEGNVCAGAKIEVVRGHVIVTKDVKPGAEIKSSSSDQNDRVSAALFSNSFIQASSITITNPQVNTQRNDRCTLTVRGKCDPNAVCDWNGKKILSTDNDSDLNHEFLASNGINNDLIYSGDKPFVHHGPENKKLLSVNSNVKHTGIGNLIISAVGDNKKVMHSGGGDLQIGHVGEKVTLKHGGNGSFTVRHIGLGSIIKIMNALGKFFAELIEPNCTLHNENSQSECTVKLVRGNCNIKGDGNVTINRIETYEGEETVISKKGSGTLYVGFVNEDVKFNVSGGKLVFKEHPPEKVIQNIQRSRGCTVTGPGLDSLDLGYQSTSNDSNSNHSTSACKSGLVRLAGLVANGVSLSSQDRVKAIQDIFANGNTVSVKDFRGYITHYYVPDRSTFLFDRGEVRIDGRLANDNDKLGTESYVPLSTKPLCKIFGPVEGVCFKGVVWSTKPQVETCTIGDRTHTNVSAIKGSIITGGNLTLQNIKMAMAAVVNEHDDNEHDDDVSQSTLPSTHQPPPPPPAAPSQSSSSNHTVATTTHNAANTNNNFTALTSAASSNISNTSTANERTAEPSPVVFRFSNDENENSRMTTELISLLVPVNQNQKKTAIVKPIVQVDSALQLEKPQDIMLITRFKAVMNQLAEAMKNIPDDAPFAQSKKDLFKIASPDLYCELEETINLLTEKDQYNEKSFSQNLLDKKVLLKLKLDTLSKAFNTQYFLDKCNSDITRIDKLYARYAKDKDLLKKGNVLLHKILLKAKEQIKNNRQKPSVDAHLGWITAIGAIIENIPEVEQHDSEEKIDEKVTHFLSNSLSSLQTLPKALPKVISENVATKKVPAQQMLPSQPKPAPANTKTKQTQSSNHDASSSIKKNRQQSSNTNTSHTSSLLLPATSTYSNSNYGRTPAFFDKNRNNNISTGVKNGMVVTNCNLFKK